MLKRRLRQLLAYGISVEGVVSGKHKGNEQHNQHAIQDFLFHHINFFPSALRTASRSSSQPRRKTVNNSEHESAKDGIQQVLHNPRRLRPIRPKYPHPQTKIGAKERSITSFISQKNRYPANPSTAYHKIKPKLSFNRDVRIARKMKSP